MKPPPKDPPLPPVDPFSGPYSTANGTCAYGDPVNGMGRCANLNSVPSTQTRPPGCPTRTARSTELLSWPVARVTELATALGVTIPPLLSGTALIVALVPAILLAEGYPAA